MSREDFDDRVGERDDEYDRPLRPRSNGMATAAMILGIISLCVGPLLGIPAIICGILGASRSGTARVGKGPSIAGIILGSISLLIIPIEIALLLPAVQKVREAAARSKDSNNMKQTALGLHNYNDLHHARLPGPFLSEGKNGPNRGLSWRVAILPFIDQEAVYRQFHIDQAWNSPANTPASQTVIPTYLSVSDPPDNQTRFRAFVGPGTAFEDETLGIPRSFPDGTSNTLLFVETADRVPWASPQDIPYQPGGPLPALGVPGRSTFLAVMADGSVKYLKKNISPGVMHAIITRNGNETLPTGWDQ